MAEFLEPGTVAPDFDTKDHEGRPVRLSTLRGKPVVLYFYPQDDTPGCTREACAFRDDFDTFRAQDALVFGISTQGVESHRAFREKYGLTFPLLADPEGRIARAYKALGILGLAKRVTYVIDASGTILGAFQRLDPKSHSEEALRLLASQPS